MIKKIAFLCGISGALLFIVTSVLAGLGIEGYSHITQYISESYAIGTPNANLWQGFYMVIGVLLFLFGIFGAWEFPKQIGVKIGFVVFAICYGFGTLVTGIFPCDMGCILDAEDPSLSQFIHNTAGALAYSVTPFCLLLIGFLVRRNPSITRYSKFTILCGLLSLIFVGFLFSNPEGAYKGLFQRIIEMSILSWILYSSIFIKRL